MANVEAHITGTVWKIEVEVGDTVEEGDTVVILESMKMEMPVEAEDEGRVKPRSCARRASRSPRATPSSCWSSGAPRRRQAAAGPSRADHVARLTIDNPAKRNALDHAILDAFAADAARARRARCLILTAEGPVFSAGYDIGGLPKDEFAHQAESLVAHPFHDAIAALDAFPYPAVAALNGHAIGGGLELALTCDLRMAAAGAKLGMPPAKLGLVYSHTGLRKFIDAIGVPRTRDLFFTARNVSAATALEWGMVNEVVAGREARRARRRLRDGDRRQRAALAGRATSA